MVSYMIHNCQRLLEVENLGKDRFPFSDQVEDRFHGNDRKRRLCGFVDVYLEVFAIKFL